MHLKKIPSKNTAQFREINTISLKKMSEDCSALVDHGVKIDLCQFGIADQAELLNNLPSSLILVQFTIDKATDHFPLSLIVETQAAICLSQLLRRMPITVNRDQIPDTDDQDGFNEVVNVLRGAVNLVIDEKTGAEYDIEHKGLVITEPEESHKSLKTVFVEKQYVVAKAEMKIEDFGDTHLFMIWPVEAVELFFGKKTEDDPKAILIHNDGVEPPFDATGLNLLTCQVKGDDYFRVRDFVLNHREAKAVMLSISTNESETMQICEQIVQDLFHKNIPVIVLLSEPTHDMVMAAIEAGVTDVVALPATGLLIKQRLGLTGHLNFAA